MEDKTIETQNQFQIDDYKRLGPVTLGPWTSHIYRSDPRHLSFLLARYKFCSKMLSGKAKVLEVGCGDAFGMPVVLQTVGTIHGIDFEPLILEDAKKRFTTENIDRCSFSVCDLTAQAVEDTFDAAYSLDVIEHVPSDVEKSFMSNLCASLVKSSVCLIGTPNIESQKYASPASAAGHINLKSAQTLQELMSSYFENTFIFSMNDEVVHTGYYPMAHYLIALGCGLK